MNSSLPTLNKTSRDCRMTLYTPVQKKRVGGFDVVSMMLKNVAKEWHALTHPVRHHFSCQNHKSVHVMFAPLLLCLFLTIKKTKTICASTTASNVCGT